MVDYNPTITRIVGTLLQPNDSQTFAYTLEGHRKEILGLLATNHLLLSISFINGKDIEIDRFEISHTNPEHIPPQKRILFWEENLKESRLIKGSITNISSKLQPVSLYLITQS